MSTPKKSAFDILMNKTNKQPKSQNSPLKKITKALPIADETILIQDDLSIIEEAPTDTLQNYLAQKTLFQHAHQYSDQDHELLIQLTCKTGISFVLRDETPFCPPSLSTGSILASPSKKLTKNDSFCTCEMTDQDDLAHCFDDIVFSVNNSLETETAPNEFNPNEAFDERDMVRTRSSLSKKSSSSSLQLKLPTAKRRRTEKSAPPKSLQDPGQLWTEKYQFKDANEIVTNKAQLERLREWLNAWKTKHTNRDRDTNPNSGDDESEYAYSSESDSDSSSSSGKNKGKAFYSNAIILAGPHGCGKTSSVYAVAKQLGFKLFEVNASSLRSKSHIIQELEGALDSHHVSGGKESSKRENAAPGLKIDSFFKQPPAAQVGHKPTRRSNGKKGAAEAVATKSVVNVHKESLILFDEIEIVFKEDVGFWSTVNHFVKKSKKPIVITTNDEFVQEKLNLNVERIDFERPRVDASVRFLMSVVAREATAAPQKLETSTVYEIVRECRCDMRRSLVQLQALIGGSDGGSSLIDNYKAQSRNGTLKLNSALSEAIFRQCSAHNHERFFENIFFLDRLAHRLVEIQAAISSDFFENSSSRFTRFDKLIIRDGLTDNASNPAPSQQSLLNLSLNLKSSADSSSKTLSAYSSSKTGLVKQQLQDLFNTFVALFNDDKPIGLSDWLRHGAVNKHGYASSASVDRLAQSLGKFSSSRELALEYRPYLHAICEIEEAKQQAQGARKRFLHYLSQTNIGLQREDFALLAKSSLSEKTAPPPKFLLPEVTSKDKLSSIFTNEQLYTEG